MRALVCATAIVLAAHAWVLGIWAPFAAAEPKMQAAAMRAGAATIALEVRPIVLAALPPPAPSLVPAPASKDWPVARASSRPKADASSPALHEPAASGRAGRATEAVAAAASGGAHADAVAAAEQAAPVDSATPLAPTTATALPTYRTTLPPSLDLHYELRRGDASGSALLTWRVRDDGSYALELRDTGANDAPSRKAPGALAPHWTSHGLLDGDGIAPERFAVSRRGRERHAANFRRDVGIVSFAGPSRTWPLAAGAQDRLSWMVQLAAVLQANPALAAPGARISMMVVGAHGDAGPWTFTVQRQATAEGPDGKALPVWQLERPSAHAHDPQVEVWLAPALHHLPLRARLTLPRSGESTEMRLRALHAP